MLHSALYHVVFLRFWFFKVLYYREKVDIGGLYWINFWTSVFYHVCKTLETFSLVFSMAIFNEI
jgi:hypothetical protein